MRQIIRPLGLALALAGCAFSARVAGADDLPGLLAAPEDEDIVVMAPPKPAAGIREAPDAGTLLAAGTEAEVLQSAFEKGCAKVKIVSGAHAGEAVWVSAKNVAGNGKIVIRNAGEGSSARIPAYRDEATYLKSQHAESAAGDAFIGIMSDEMIMLPQQTRVTIISAGTKLPKLLQVQILDDGKHKGAKLLVQLDQVVVEGKVRLVASGAKDVTGFKKREGLLADRGEHPRVP